MVNITCEVGGGVSCSKGSEACYDNSPIYCCRHQLPPTKAINITNNQNINVPGTCKMNAGNLVCSFDKYCNSTETCANAPSRLGISYETVNKEVDLMGLTTINNFYGTCSLIADGAGDKVNGPKTLSCSFVSYCKKPEATINF